MIDSVATTEGGFGPSEPAAVELFNITKRFGDVLAVDNLTLSIGENKFFALLGPSGCGKTTTLRMIGGFEDPTQGSINLHGDDVTGLKAYRRPVNTVFQSYALFPHLSVFENVAFGLRRTNVDKGDLERRVAEMLSLVQLSGLDNRHPAKLSGGQQQRVALARALINHPRVLLLDEPLGALDLKLRKEMQIELKRIQQEVGITFIHVTHDQEEAMTMADTIAVMNKGKIERMGDPAEIYEDPRTAFVANFLGGSNLMPVSVVDRAAGSVATADGTTIFVPPTALGAETSGLRVGVRPEKLNVYRHGSGDIPPNVLTGRILDASFIGVSTHYVVRTNTAGDLSAVVQNLTGDRFAQGEEVSLGWHPERSFVIHDD
ncbi:MAG: ABC transporter ATP-binding protein [Acidimicrobiia bacterium]|nr:ABC transporter ATP-binding protein [Acidimicrobiia bacterium]